MQNKHSMLNAIATMRNSVKYVWSGLYDTERFFSHQRTIINKTEFEVLFYKVFTFVFGFLGTCIGVMGFGALVDLEAVGVTALEAVVLFALIESVLDKQLVRSVKISTPHRSEQTVKKVKLFLMLLVLQLVDIGVGGILEQNLIYIINIRIAHFLKCNCESDLALENKNELKKKKKINYV